MDEASGSSSIGEAVSGRGGGVVGEEDVYYIPERRPSLDLGTTSMDLSYWYWYHTSLLFVSLGISIKCSAHRFICFLEYQLYLKLTYVVYTHVYICILTFLGPVVINSTLFL